MACSIQKGRDGDRELKIHTPISTSFCFNKFINNAIDYCYTLFPVCEKEYEYVILHKIKKQAVSRAKITTADKPP